MKKYLKIQLISAACMLFSLSGFSQTAKSVSACKMYLEDKVIAEVTIEDAVKWCEMTPPTVQCDDGKVYKLHSFFISYLTLKPFMNQDFGIGEGGFPIRARNAVKNGKSGDTIIMKDVTYIDSDGTQQKLPVISIKLK